MKKLSSFNMASLIVGYAFLYIPIFFVIIFSFNESRFPGIWQSFSLTWYRDLFQNDDLFDALINSLKIASMSATLAMVVGTMAALSVIRLKGFKGRNFFGGLVSAPLVMPDVMTGLSLLLMFISLRNIFGWPTEMGIFSVIIAHTTLGAAYVYMIVKARLNEMDKSLEEAAQDLGAKPLRVFFTITLPLMIPSLLSGWLLSFALSLDDVVLASFLSGPGSTTLPIVIFSSLRFGMTPEINALATIIILIVSFGIMCAGLLIQSKNKRDL